MEQEIIKLLINKLERIHKHLTSHTINIKSRIHQKNVSKL
jgi:hypothetical protein